MGGLCTSRISNSQSRFPSKMFQSEFGLQQNWMRDYDPTTRRYLQFDPLGLVDGVSCAYCCAPMTPTGEG
ncbi:RHS repeat-associated core domain-containing protein [Aliiroseovarius sp.]|uniref:RHS repeat-associated core domain-containing protein n=1 Tax=Aliiroseovarius sp. TaxID=1872442 RepID=UPI003BAD255D